MRLFCLGLQTSPNFTSATGSRRSLNYFSVFLKMPQKDTANVLQAL